MTHQRLVNKATAMADLQPDVADGDSDEQDNEDILEGSGADGNKDVVIDTSGICDGKAETGNHTVKAHFGQKQTHNKQLCIVSCGVILD